MPVMSLSLYIIIRRMRHSHIGEDPRGKANRFCGFEEGPELVCMSGHSRNFVSILGVLKH